MGTTISLILERVVTQCLHPQKKKKKKKKKKKMEKRILLNAEFCN
jgi:hypothetical protein